VFCGFKIALFCIENKTNRQPNPELQKTCKKIGADEQVLLL
jgi:hypothetical protein